MNPKNRQIMARIPDIIKRQIGSTRQKLVSIKADPRKISLGYALGIFLAATPFIGIKVPIAILLTTVLRWSKVASVIGVLHVNLLTAPVFYGFSYLVGRTALHHQTSASLPDDLTLKSICELFTHNSSVFIDLLAGGAILGVLMALAAYFFSSSLFRKRKVLHVGEAS